MAFKGRLLLLSNKVIIVKQINATFRYSYEYIGPTTRIVITPLTDKCWITITSALNIGLGAAPAGPAGTGKTESTKDLAKALGRFCIVFNCSEQVEITLIERLFRGVCYQGACKPCSLRDLFGRVQPNRD